MASSLWRVATILAMPVALFLGLALWSMFRGLPVFEGAYGQALSLIVIVAPIVITLAVIAIVARLFR